MGLSHLGLRFECNLSFVLNALSGLHSTVLSLSWSSRGFLGGLSFDAPVALAGATTLHAFMPAERSAEFRVLHDRAA